MDPERWAAIESLYQAAMEKNPAERSRWLSEACRHDEELRAEVESLLTCAGVSLSNPAARPEAARLWEAVAGQPLAASVAAGAGNMATVTSLPATIGRYRILRLVGQGGMGFVYEAEQEHPRRTVALKVIKPGLVDLEMVRRFERESLALGRLQHPGIAQVYEADSADGGFGPQPYFAMEFIHGPSLLEYADSHKLSTRQRLELMAKICDAVQHAHQRGIIHRDLKPGNILVDEIGQPKILDFGVARVTNSDAQPTQQTDLGQLVGTLAYMSPEQVLADPLELDTRSDVYALGVILYELLAGRLPYKVSHKVHEAVQAIREEEPSALSMVNSVFCGDIETIVGKALEKDKTRRYASAAELGADLRRHLQDEPIMARPASTAYQLKKFAWRHRGLVAGVAAVFVVLVAGIVVSTWVAARANAEAAKAKAISDFLQNDLLAQASAANQSGPKTKPDPDLKVRTVLDRAAAKILGKFKGQPEVEASVRSKIGQTYMGLGLYPEARRQLENAVELQRRVLGVMNPETLKTTSQIGYAAYLQGKYPEAEQILSKNLDVQRHVLGPEHPDTLYCMNFLATVYWAQGKFPQAEALYSQTLQIRRRLLGPEHRETLNSINNLAMVFTEEDKEAQAEILYRQALEIQRRVLGHEHPETLSSSNNLSVVYESQGKFAQAEDLARESLEIERRVLGPEHPLTLSSVMNLAMFCADEGKYMEAETLFRQNLETRRRVLGPEHPETLRSMMNLAPLYAAEGKYAQGEALAKQTLEIERRVLGPEHPGTLATLSDLASLHQREGKYILAETFALEVLKLRRHAAGSDDSDTMVSAADLALAYVSQERFVEAEPLAREALKFNQERKPDDWQRFRDESLLGASLTGQNKYAEAELLLLEGYQRMVAQKDRIAAPEWYHLDRAREWLIELYEAWGKPAKAAEWRKPPPANGATSHKDNL